MKYLISIFTCCFIINLHAAEKEKDYTDEIYARLFGKKIVEKHGVTKSKEGFPSDLLPIIGRYVVDYKDLNKKAKNWLLKELFSMFDDPPPLTYSEGTCAYATLKKFDMHDTNEEIICFTYCWSIEERRGSYAEENSYPGLATLNKKSLLNKPQKPFSRLLRAKIYLEEKIHLYHKELLNNIYEKGIEKEQPYQLSLLEEKHFKLLPKSFQEVLESFVKLSAQSRCNVM